MNNIHSRLPAEAEKKKPLCLATILETRGSAPQVQGTSALFGKDGLLAGTLGGGILEAKAIEKAKEALRRGASMICVFDLAEDMSSPEGAVCGGSARILIDADPGKHTEVFRSMQASLEKGLPGVLTTRVSMDFSVERFWFEQGFPQGAPHTHGPAELEDKIKACQREDACRFEKQEDGTSLFLEPFRPLPRLIIAGAGHIGKALSHQANLLDFEVTVIDDRKEYANPENIPEADRLIVGDIGSSLQKIPITKDSYIVIVTRGHSNDAEALKVCITSEAAYIGMIGSRRKVRLMREEFLSRGWATPAQWERLHAPIGLEIHSKTVHEIAVSIAAQLIQVRGRRPAGRVKPCITILVPAAGESKRMGRPKLILPYGGSSILGTVVRNACASSADHVLVVLGSNKDVLEKEIRDHQVKIAVNRQYRSGMLSSVKCGLKELPGGTDAVMVMLGDQPMIGRKVLDQMIHAYREYPGKILVAIHGGKRGHPLLFSSGFAGEILEMSGSQSLRNLLERHADRVIEVPVDSPEILRDIDTEKDYQYELKIQSES